MSQVEQIITKDVVKKPRTKKTVDVSKELIKKPRAKKTQTESKTNSVTGIDASKVPPKQKISSKMYLFPIESEIKYDAERYFNCLPNSKYWVHGEQCDDVIDESAKRRIAIIEEIKKIKVPEQRSVEWFKQRDGMITASDGGLVIGVNHSEPRYNCVIKKLIKIPFTGGEFCHHGKKYEHIATMIYMYRMNVIVHEYGLVEHPVHKFIGASPDGIVDQYKFDGVHKTKMVGRMLEIKCPYKRKINMTSSDVFDVCPIYYHAQVQLQLECCDLDECDFWQCEISEYNDRTEFINDTDVNEPFRSKSTGFEKGCVILLIPFGNITKDLQTVIYDDSKFIYPPKIEMTPYEYDQWIAEQMATYQSKEEFRGYTVLKTIYWKLEKSRCFTIKRDRQWFAEVLPIFEKTWKYVTFFRKNKKPREILLKYIEHLESIYPKPTSASVKKGMDALEILYTNNEKQIKLLEDEMTPKCDSDDFGWTVC